MANSSLDISSLDFNTLKTKFITFLKADPTFKDYNFEGSNMNVLLDVMSYNSYLNSFYLNMVASEMFLDSAQKLDSVISHAKELNYLPRSFRSPEAFISFNINTQGVSNPFVIPKNTIFSGSNSNGSFNFITKQETSYLSATSTYTILDLPIYEGYDLNDVFIVDYSQETQSFVLSNKNVDTNSLIVNVSEDSGTTNTVYKNVTTLYGLSSFSNVYFLESSANQSYEIVFGDNVFGHKPINGSIVYVNYRATSGSDGNGINQFELTQDLGPTNGGTVFTPTINVISYSVGGANSETIESIRFNAPRHYQTQGRCVTAQDYISTVIQNFPEIQYVNVYAGGVTNTSVEYGKIYVTPSTYSGTTLTNNRKLEIENYLNSLSPIGISVKTINPSYLYISLDVKNYVNFTITKSSPSTIKTKIISAIKKYNDDNLQNFNTAFRLSKLEQQINEADDGILSNETYAKIYREYSPPLNINHSISCIMQNSLVKGSIISSQYQYLGKNYVFTDFINGVDSGNGIVYRYEQNASLITPNYSIVGNVDYKTGIININETKFSSVIGSFKIFATPVNKDIYCKDNIIIEIDTISGISIETVSE
jgi:hypothetical protein